MSQPLVPSFGDLSRRSFLNRLAVLTAAAGSTSSIFPVSPPLAVADCRLYSHGLLSPGLEKFAAAIKPGSDQFLCERYAADLEPLFEKWRRALRASAYDIAPLKEAVSADIDFAPFHAFESKSLRNGPAIRAERIQFQARHASGREAFFQSLSSYLRDFSEIQTAEFLICGLQIKNSSPAVIEASIRYDLVGFRGPNHREERTGIWSLECRREAGGQWMIHAWRSTDEIRAGLAGRGFADITAEALRGNESAQRQFIHGVDYWRSTIDGATGIDVYGNNGVAVGDYDGDGLDDLYVCQPAGLPNRLFRNRGDGTFKDVTEGLGLGLLDGTAAALFADFTNSGTQDLIIVRTNGPLLYLNRGGGKFELKPDAFHFAKPPAGTFTGIAAADYDRDGLLDVYFCLYAYYQGLSQYTHPQPYYDAQNGPPNFLMRNRGDGAFEDVTESSRINENNNRYTFACGWCDYNSDGWPDLYVANDFGRKNLYHNNGDGTFRDIAHEAGVEDFGAGMSVSWFDYDGDGRQDLYVTDMYSAAGMRVTEQDVFLPGVDAKVRAAYRKHARGNSLFHNNSGSQPFADVSGKARITMGRWSWSGDAWDFDHDGNTDLYVTNGFISGTNRQDLASFFWRQIVARSLNSGGVAVDYELAWNAINELIRSDYSWNGYERNVFFVNLGDSTFAEVSGSVGLDYIEDSRAFALADFDGDGRLEVVLKNRTGPQLRILHNDLDPIGKSIAFRLRGRKSNRDAIGAIVTLECDSTKQVKFVRAGSGFLSQHTKDLSFGLGSNTAPAQAIIQWPSGFVQRLENLPSQHLIVVEEGELHWSAKAFTRAKLADTNATLSLVAEKLPEHFESWLIEPLPALGFSLQDTGGETRSLKSFAGKPLLLALVRGNCDASCQQLLSLAKSSALFARQAVQIAALCLDTDSGALRQFSRRNKLPFPVLLADVQTTGIYSILYRYLFDRRRELEAPTLLLLNAHGEIFKVEQGSAEPARILQDFASAPTTTAARFPYALPFRGHYHGGPPRRNFFTYGVAFIQNNYPDAALVCFKESISRNPNYAAAYYNVGTIYLNKQMLPEAKANLERAVELDPQDADALTNLGAVAGQEKDYDTAYRYFERALRVRPNHMLALQNLVLLDRWKGQLDKGQQALANAIAVDPDEPEFHFALGMLLASQNKFEEARAELDRAVHLRPTDSIALNNLGVVFLRLDKLQEARECFDRCIRMAPDYDRPFLNVASIYQQQGDLQKARDVLKGFLSRHPDNRELSQALQSISR